MAIVYHVGNRKIGLSPTRLGAGSLYQQSER